MCEENKLILTDINEKRFLFLLNQRRLLSVYPFDLQKDSLLNHIYIGKIQNIVTNIQAAFVEIQKGILGFLPLSDCQSRYPSPKAGDEIVVQVSKDAVKTKLPMLTTKINLAGTYCVLSLPATIPQIHVSDKLSRQDASKIKQYLLQAGISEPGNAKTLSYDMIVRTKAGELSDYEPLFKEYQQLSEELTQILTKSSTRTCFSCLRKSNFPSWIQELQNIPVSDYDEIITDSEEIHAQIAEYQNSFPTANRKPLRLYCDQTYPLKTLYGINSKLEYALNRRIWLKSGAYIIIEPTEAMTVIDVNTGKYEAKKQKSETFLTINKEAAEEIALQIKLRNLSGIILVDFINMESKEHQRELLQFMRSRTEQDRIRTNVIDITPLGLMEITRKKVRKPLHEELGEQYRWN